MSSTVCESFAIQDVFVALRSRPAPGRPLLQLFPPSGENKKGRTQLLGIAADVARGLQFLHSRRVVHRDIAARNFLLNEAFWWVVERRRSLSRSKRAETLTLFLSPPFSFQLQNR